MAVYSVIPFTGVVYRDILNTTEPSLTELVPTVLSLLWQLSECATYLDEQQYVQHFGFPLAVLLS